MIGMAVKAFSETEGVSVVESRRCRRPSANWTHDVDGFEVVTIRVRSDPSAYSADVFDLVESDSLLRLDRKKWLPWDGRESFVRGD